MMNNTLSSMIDLFYNGVAKDVSLPVFCQYYNATILQMFMLCLCLVFLWVFCSRNHFARLPLIAASPIVAVSPISVSGVTLLRPEDHLGGLRGHAGQEQPSCACAKHSVHPMSKGWWCECALRMLIAKLCKANGTLAEGRFWPSFWSLHPSSQHQTSTEHQSTERQEHPLNTPQCKLPLALVGKVYSFKNARQLYSFFPP